MRTETRACEYCGKTFEVWTGSAKMFCSAECGYKGRNRRHSLKVGGNSYLENYYHAKAAEAGIVKVETKARKRGLSYGQMQAVLRQMEVGE